MFRLLLIAAAITAIVAILVGAEKQRHENFVRDCTAIRGSQVYCEYIWKWGDK